MKQWNHLFCWVFLALGTGCVRPQTSTSSSVIAQESSSVRRAESDVTLARDANAQRVETATADASMGEPRQVNVVNGKLVFDAVVCEPSQGIVYWGMGSVTVKLVGKQGDRCVFELRNETEGGYSDHACRVLAQGTIRVEETSGRPRQSWSDSDCREQGGGNLLMPGH